MCITMKDLKAKGFSVNEFAGDAKKLVDYDFRDDCIWKRRGCSDDELNKKRGDFIGIDSSIEKFFIYKFEGESFTENQKKNYKKACKFMDDKGYGKVKLVDPDSNSSLLQEIYRKLWNKPILKLCNDKTIHGDTMNSVTTTLNEYVRFIFLEYVRFYGSKEIDGPFTDKDGKPLKAIKEETLEIYCQAKEDFIRYCIQENRGLDKFLKASYTLGNFIPVPFESGGGQFNAPRYKNTNDYWDLTLLRIYNWYKENESLEKDAILEKIENECDCNKNKELCLLLGRNCANVKLCIKWLCAFGSWKEFVEKNYMQPFVGKEDVNGNYGAPLELWEGHFKRYEDGIFKNPLPLCKEQCEEFFKNATKRIKERSERMAEKFRSAK